MRSLRWLGSQPIDFAAAGLLRSLRSLYIQAIDFAALALRSLCGASPPIPPKEAPTPLDGVMGPLEEQSSEVER